MNYVELLALRFLQDWAFYMRGRVIVVMSEDNVDYLKSKFEENGIQADIVFGV